MLSVFYFFGPFGENTLCVGFVWTKHLFISNDNYDDASGRVEGILKTEEGLRGQKELLTTGPQSQTAAGSCILWLSLHFAPKTDT